MARAPHGSNQPPKVIYKKVYVEGHGGHHGGAWKVAYADFVTAMMAFFLLLWLLGATTEKQRKGIADYFAPTLLNTRSIGIGGSGLFGGESILDTNRTGPRPGQSAAQFVAVPRDVTGRKEDGKGGDKRDARGTAAEDRKAFEAMRRQVMGEIAGSASLARLSNHVRFVMTRDGMRIDLVDDADYSMFASGTTVLDGEASRLIGMIAGAIRASTNPIMIRGHTDSVPFGDPRAMNNWLLSSGPAAAPPRRLARGGLPPTRVARIEGGAGPAPMIADNALDARNRRVAITLLYRRGVFGQ